MTIMRDYTRLVLMYGMHVGRNKHESTLFMSGKSQAGNGFRRRPQLPSFKIQDYPDRNVDVYTGSHISDAVGLNISYYLLVECSVLQVELSILLLLTYRCDSCSVKWIRIDS